MFEGSTGLWDPAQSGLTLAKTRWQSDANIRDIKFLFLGSVGQVCVNLLIALIGLVINCRRKKEERQIHPSQSFQGF